MTIFIGLPNNDDASGGDPQVILSLPTNGALCNSNSAPRGSAGGDHAGRLCLTRFDNVSGRDLKVSGRVGRTLKRAIIFSLVALGTAAIASMIIRWVGYRYRNIVSSDAVIKGYVSYIGARIMGKVASISVEDGQPVKKGQVIARLEDQAYLASVARAKSDLDRITKLVTSTQLSIEYDSKSLTAKVANAESALRVAERQIESAKAMAQLGQQDYDIAYRLQTTNRTTYGLKFGLQADINHKIAVRDSAQAELGVAQSLRDAAEAALQTARVALAAIESRRAGLKVLEAEAEVARSALAIAEADLDATYIRAPEDGWIVRRIVDVGGSVRLGYPILAMRLGRHAWVEAWVHESQMIGVRVGNPAEVAFGALPGRIFRGRVEAIGALSNTELQGAVVPPTLGQLIRPPTMVDIRITLIENDERLVPGLTAIVGISKEPGGPSSGKGGAHD